ncbi:uncharacterized protein LOC127252649 [Andrographis paniculata]|uniref:uncharacterized protein LOC127252649 n=1 Tax=Andrographis paniculata TaxID=175694 RepID=UPI0021E77504|nr:uncharacterized protein LOC127252649 [Andrographis paniculata]
MTAAWSYRRSSRRSRKMMPPLFVGRISRCLVLWKLLLESPERAPAQAPGAVGCWSRPPSIRRRRSNRRLENFVCLSAEFQNRISHRMRKRSRRRSSTLIRLPIVVFRRQQKVLRHHIFLSSVSFR